MAYWSCILLQRLCLHLHLSLGCRYDYENKMFARNLFHNIFYFFNCNIKNSKALPLYTHDIAPLWRHLESKKNTEPLHPFYRSCIYGYFLFKWRENKRPLFATWQQFCSYESHGRVPKFLEYPPSPSLKKNSFSYSTMHLAILLVFTLPIFRGCRG